MPFTERAGAHFLLSDGASQPSERTRVRMPLPFASIGMSLIDKLGKAGSKGRVEEHTGVEYPLEFCLTHKPCPQLAGLGVRSKRILGLKNIDVYAAGVYFDGTAAKKNLGHKYKGKDSSDPELMEGFISDGGIEKTLRLVIHFSHLKRSQFVDALNDRLAPELKKSGDSSALDSFKQQFNDVQFHKGTEIAFTQTGPQLITRVDGKEVGRMTNKALSHALWSIYLGQDPVSPQLKTTTASTLAAVIHG